MRSVVVAAHPDDELLGLSRLVIEGQVGHVVYVLPGAADVEMQRRLSEAQTLASRFGYTISVLSFGEAPDPHQIAQFLEADRVFVPAPTDAHREHQMALTWALQNFGTLPRLMEYSIEKSAPYVHPLRTVDVAQKRNVFRDVYPSQLDVLLDPKYFLFEGWASLGVPSITMRFKEPGMHFWKGATGAVNFLGFPHRHLFGVSLTLNHLAHHDRDQEFLLVQAWAREEFRKLLAVAATEGSSCEMMARDLAIRARAKYRVSVTVEVDEDGENSAVVTV